MLGNANATDAYVFLNDGFGEFTAAPGSPSTAGTNANMAATGDFRGNGKIDLVVADSDANNVAFVRGNSDGAFQTANALTAEMKTKRSHLRVGSTLSYQATVLGRNSAKRSS